MSNDITDLKQLKVILDSGELVGALGPGLNDALGDSVDFLERTGNKLVAFKRKVLS